MPKLPRTTAKPGTTTAAKAPAKPAKPASDGKSSAAAKRAHCGQAQGAPRRRGSGRARLRAPPGRQTRRPRSGRPEDEPHRGPAGAAGRPVRGRRGARGRGGRAGRPRAGREVVRVRLRPACRPAPRQRRGLHRAPDRRRKDLRRHAARHGHAVRGAAARHRRGHERVTRRGGGRVRRGDRRARGRRDQAVRSHVPEPGRPPGRELPQDARRDGPGHPGHPDQARRPAAQHAHDRLDAEAQAAGEGEGDARDLRPPRAQARHPRDQVGARGPRLRHAPPAQVQRDQAAGLAAARRSRGLRLARRRVPGEGAGGGRHRGPDLRPRQALLLDLLEDDEEGARVQRDLRPHRDAGDRRAR